MHKLIRQPSPITTDNDFGGDFGLLKDETWIRRPREGELNADTKGIVLEWIDPNPWRGLAYLINHERLARQPVVELRDSCKYVCVYTEQTFYSLFPFLLVSNDPAAYFAGPYIPHFAEIAMDLAWNKGAIDNPGKSQIAQAVLGPGYDHGFMLNDGDVGQELVVIDLDNGDSIFAVSHVWYGK